jgi:stress-induced-phosphoprotein 1
MFKIFLEYKNKENKFFGKKQWEQALNAYTESIKADPTYIISYSNRCLIYINCKEYEKAIEDGLKCIKLDNKFIKGYYRTCTALYNLKRYEECKKVLKKAYKNGFRRNKDLVILNEKNEKKLKIIELEKRKHMSKYELLKCEGDDLFKEGNYEKAILKYSKVIMKDKIIPENILISCLNNRSLCYQQFNKYRDIISDCSQVLDIKSNDLKALFRRSLAFEAIEKYRLALDDIRKVLYINPKCKKANEIQYRLSRSVRQSKKMSK